MSIISMLPGEILSLILSRLPVRDVLVCKCVCNTWLDLISSSEFVKMHLNFHRGNSGCRLMFNGIQNPYGSGSPTLMYSISYDSLASLLLPEIEDANNNNNHGEIEDENSDSDVEIEEESGIEGYASPIDHPFNDSDLDVDMCGSCDGCVCLWYHEEDDTEREQFFCLWNPATNKYKILPKAPKRYNRYCDIDLHALVYDSRSDDYKFIFAVTPSSNNIGGFSSLVHVYTVGSDSWRSFQTPHWFYSCQKSGTLFNGHLHWLADDCIVYFDVTSEKFEEIQPPLKCSEILLLGVLEDCLCVLVKNEDLFIDIWAMQVYGDPKSWTKHHTITHEIITRNTLGRVCPLTFRWSFKNGVILFTYNYGLVLYDPEHGSGIERRVKNYMSSAENFSESLVSLNFNTYFGGGTEFQTLKNENSALQTRSAELAEHIAQLVASNAELQRKLHESQIAYQDLEQRVKSQVLENENSVLQTRNVELAEHNAQLVASNAELQRKLHESQLAYQHLEQRVKSQVLENENSVLQTRNVELAEHNAQLVASNAELQRKLHESQLAYQHLEQRVKSQKEEEEGKKDDGEQKEMAIPKKQIRKTETNHRYNTRNASKAVAAML